jgi:hypothetical protein
MATRRGDQGCDAKVAYGRIGRGRASGRNHPPPGLSYRVGQASRHPRARALPASSYLKLRCHIGAIRGSSGPMYDSLCSSSAFRFDRPLLPIGRSIYGENFVRRHREVCLSRG